MRLGTEPNTATGSNHLTLGHDIPHLDTRRGNMYILAIQWIVCIIYLKDDTVPRKEVGNSNSSQSIGVLYLHNFTIGDSQ
jgi:hypothetical protein